MPEPIDQIEFLIYGKIIIDHIRSSAGRIGSNVLGGGGPQAAFGARLWNDSIGLITRSGKDLSDDHIASLKQLNIDLEGWHGFDDIPTPQCLLQYNETEAIVNGRLISNHHDWANLLLMNLSLPRHYRNPRALHLITEFPHEEMALDALQMRKHGTIISLEPLIDPNDWDNRDSMLNLIRQVDIVTPDWQSASSIANCREPRRVVEYWSRLGPSMVAIRHGKNGSYVWDTLNDLPLHIPAIPTKTVDPTGAGNAFGGGLCVGWVEKQDAELAGCYGTISARFMLQQFGLPKITESLCRAGHALIPQVKSQICPLQ